MTQDFGVHWPLTKGIKMSERVGEEVENADPDVETSDVEDDDFSDDSDDSDED